MVKGMVSTVMLRGKESRSWKAVETIAELFKRKDVRRRAMDVDGWRLRRIESNPIGLANLVNSENVGDSLGTIPYGKTGLGKTDEIGGLLSRENACLSL